MKFIKKLLFFTTILCLTLNFIGCEKSPKNESLINVNLASLSLDASLAPLIIAINNGYFLQEGLDVKASYIETEDLVMEDLMSGRSDIALTGSNSAAYPSVNGEKDYPVYFASVLHKNPDFLVARDEYAKLTFDDFRAKTIITSTAKDTNYTALDYILNKNKINPKRDVNKISNLELTNISTAFESGTGDFALVNLQDALSIQSNENGKILFSLGKKIGNSESVNFVAKKSYIKKNPDIIQKFTNAIYKAQIYIDTHSSNEIIGVINSSFLSEDSVIIKKSIEKYKKMDLWSKNPVVTEKNYNSMIKIASTNSKKLKKNPPTYSKITDNTYSNKAIKNIKSLE